MLTTLGNETIGENLKEASELLGCIDIKDEKLEVIVEKLSFIIKNNPRMKKLVEKLVNATNDGGNVDSIEELYDLLNNGNMLSLVRSLVVELGDNKEVIDNIEKDILPELFKND